MFELKIKVDDNFIKIKDKNRREAIIECFNELDKITIISYGLYGVVDIESCKYLIYITEKTKKIDFENNEIFEINQVGVLKLSKSSHNNEKQLNNIINFFQRSGIYYSSYPLYKETSFGKSCGGDFIFNLKLLEEMEKFCSELKQFGVKCIQGFYGAEHYRGIKLFMISRRSWRRSGTRFFSRGSSSDGYVSNYVETELFFHTNNIKMSYLQVRGSIPLSWSHEVMLNYTPKLVIHKKDYFTKCDAVLRNKYSQILYLNLIKNKKYEKHINEKFNAVLKENKCKFINYDLHGSGSFQNQHSIFAYLTNIKNYLDNYGFKTSEVKQKGVIRTNCIDCLDRTNLAQFIISEEIVKRMCDYSKIQICDEILKLNRKLWFNNGNKISMQYSGTGALKSYIIGDTSRNWLGCLDDLYKSISRYFINRYSHGSLQDTYDILTGRNILKKRRKYSKTWLFTSGQFAFVCFLIGFLTVSNFSIAPCKFLLIIKNFMLFIISILILLSFIRNYPRFDNDD